MYRVLFFENAGDAGTLDNPLPPMPTEDFADIAEAREIGKATAETIRADFMVIEDDKGDVIERWRCYSGEWRRLDA
jgi:hypothetical protein